MTGRKTKRRVIIIIACVLAVLIAIIGGVFIKMNSEQKEMSPLETGEFLPGIYAINNGFVNMFLIKCGDEYIAVDAGMSTSAVRQGLSQLGISSDDVTAVLLTHTHGDHTAALKLFDKAVIYSANEKFADKIVSDGEMISINDQSIEVIATSGHADDSVCYLYDGQYLFAGDNLSLKEDRVGLFNSVYNKSDEQQKADIAKLAGLNGVRYVITAHYGFSENPIFPQ